VSGVSNRGLFRMYAALWFAAAATAVTLALQLTGAPDLAIAIYLGIGAALWGADLVVTGTVRQPDHGLARLVLLAAFALAWPVALVALVALLARAVIRDVQQPN
jgi:hypothetical protein